MSEQNPLIKGNAYVDGKPAPAQIKRLRVPVRLTARQRLWYKIQRLRGLLVELPTYEIVVAEMDSPPPAGSRVGFLYEVSFEDGHVREADE